MRDQLLVQERMVSCLDSLAEETHKLCSQSQEDGAKMTVISLELQELIPLVGEWSRTVRTDLEEVNGHFDCHRTEINQLKRRERELEDLVIAAGHEVQVFKTQLD